MRLWLARHAVPLIAPGTCYGALDMDADAAATQAAAERLAATLPPGIAIDCSPLARCRQLAQALRALRPDLGATNTDPRIAEMAFGSWEGVRWDDMPKADIDAWVADFANHAPGGGESVIQFMDRVGEAFDAARRDSRERLWITHAGVIRAAALLGDGVRAVTQARQWRGEAIDFGQWRVMEIEPRGVAP